MNTKFSVCCAALLWMLLQSGIASASGTGITIQNGSFNQTPVTTPPKDWKYASNEAGGSVTQSSGTAQFYKSGWIYQNTGVSLLANQTYVLSLNLWCVGISPCYGDSEYPGDIALELWAGSTWCTTPGPGCAQLVTGTTVSSVDITTSQTFSLVFSTTSNSSLIGQQIWVRIIQIQETPARVEAVNLGNVTLTYYPSGTGSPKLVQGPVSDISLWSSLCTDGTQTPCTKLLDLQYSLPYDGLDISTNAGANALCDYVVVGGDNPCGCSYTGSGPTKGADNCDNTANAKALLSGVITPALWGRFTENYMDLTVTSLIDWYDDTSFNEILNKIGIVAEIAEAGNTQGIFFDPEGNNQGATFTYSSYSQLLPGVTYADMANEVYARGVEVGERIVDGNSGDTCKGCTTLPGMTKKHFMVAKWTSLLPPTTGGYNFWLQGNTYDLLTPFMLGILSELDLGSGNTIIDGSEKNDYAASTVPQYALSQTAIYTTAINDGVIPTAVQGSYNQNMFYSSAMLGDLTRVQTPYMSNLSGIAQSAYTNASPVHYSQGPSNLSWFFYTSGSIPVGANEALQQAKAVWLAAQ